VDFLKERGCRRKNERFGSVWGDQDRRVNEKEMGSKLRRRVEMQDAKEGKTHSKSKSKLKRKASPTLRCHNPTNHPMTLNELRIVRASRALTMAKG